MQSTQGGLSTCLHNASGAGLRREWEWWWHRSPSSRTVDLWGFGLAFTYSGCQAVGCEKTRTRSTKAPIHQSALYSCSIQCGMGPYAPLVCSASAQLQERLEHSEMRVLSNAFYSPEMKETSYEFSFLSCPYRRAPSVGCSENGSTCKLLRTLQRKVGRRLTSGCAPPPFTTVWVGHYVSFLHLLLLAA